MALYTIRYSLAGQQFLLTSHLHPDISEPIPNGRAELQRVLNWAKDNVIPALTTVLSNSVTVVDHRIQKVYPTRQAYIQDTIAAIGTVDELPMPVNSAAAITRRSIDSGRWAQGTLHIGGLPLSSLSANGGSIVLAALPALLTLGEAMIGPWATLAGNPTWYPSLWSPGNPTRITPLVSAAVQTTVRTMHRRTVGLGV